MLLDVQDLETVFAGADGVVHAVDHVSFQLRRGEVLGLVGESGCGKSVSALSIMRLLPSPPARVRGRVLFDGRDLLTLSDSEMRAVRGNQIAMIFQDPMTSLNPVLPIATQIIESIQLHMGLGQRAARARAAELLALVGIPNAKDRLNDYQHQFSGGMRQRVMIAMALSCDPKLLIADEPTTALDVTIQAQILDLMRRLRDQLGMAMILITHDLGVAAGTCDRINVMYAGRIVETGPVDTVFEQPRMPYSWGLLESMPRLDHVAGSLLATIEGAPPELTDTTERCRFAPRCSYVRDVCREREPVLSPRGSSIHLARCFGTEPDGWIERA
ncbi:MAG TPA: ABC transporter ATP-binding protein [Candidatus Limnocylindria bacterium]|nr:ABC transporter ATP-binding protein [Candidatus Limnocylindria bacterium]